VHVRQKWCRSSDCSLSRGAQVLSRLDTSKLGALEQRVEYGRDLGAAHGFAISEVLSADDWPSG
jgi:hypothetical protein